MSTFATLGVKKPFIQSIKELGIHTPSEIQEKTIPILLNKRTDFVGLAQTGTGKTAAFGLPIVQQINPSNTAVQALILSPTRELVQQIKKQLFKYTKYYDHKVFVEAVYGGEKIDRQIHNLERTTHIIVATPGRLIDLIERGNINLKEIKTLVLDEADEMLSMGFKNDLTSILKTTKGSKSTWLFSATMPEDLKAIVKRYIKEDAVRLEINRNHLVNANISHYFVETSIPKKIDTLISILEERDEERGIIFCRTKAGTQALAHQLKQEGFNVDALEGDMQQKEREKVMRAFKNSNLQILISTDVSARGIDVNNVTHAINYNLPEEAENYTHRSGRTGRAGKLGTSIVIVTKSEIRKISSIERIIKQKFEEKTIPSSHFFIFAICFSNFP